jgi:hypothetical protein
MLCGTHFWIRYSLRKNYRSQGETFPLSACVLTHSTVHRNCACRSSVVRGVWIARWLSILLQARVPSQTAFAGMFDVLELTYSGYPLSFNFDICGTSDHVRSQSPAAVHTEDNQCLDNGPLSSSEYQSYGEDLKLLSGFQFW